jgi:hypothetical protein
MRKLIAILSLVLLIGCSPYRIHTYYQKEYDKTEYDLMIVDAYNIIDSIGLDPLPLREWLTYQEYTESGYHIERIYQKRIDNQSEFLFVMQTHVEDTLKYIFIVKFRTKNPLY